MLLNCEKSLGMRFVSNDNHRDLAITRLRDYNIHQTDAMKFLGVTIESTLTWRKRIHYINSKLNSLGYMFHSLRNVLSLVTIKQIYFVYIYSGLNYGIIFWGNSPHRRAILINQKRNMRIIMKANTRISCRMLFRKLGNLSFYS